MKKLLLLPVVALALTACGGSSDSGTPQPVETHNPSYYNPTGTWDIEIANSATTSFVTAIVITSDHVSSNNDWAAFRYLNPQAGWTPVDTQSAVASGNTQKGDVSINDSIYNYRCQGSFDTSKNTYSGTCVTARFIGFKYPIVMTRR